MKNPLVGSFQHCASSTLTFILHHRIGIDVKYDLDKAFQATLADGNKHGQLLCDS